MPAALTGKVALVTGASRGIGRGIALQLGEAGATVYVTGRQPKQSDGGREQEKPATDGDRTQTALPTLQETADQVGWQGAVLMSGPAALPGKVALVTGASRGIGRGIALQLGEAGATVYVTGRQSKQSDGGREQEKPATDGDRTQTALPTLQETADQVGWQGAVLMSGPAALPGKVALVTGASRGIGRGIALQLGEAGATVYVTGRQSKQSDGGREQEKPATDGDRTQTALPTLQETADQVGWQGAVLMSGPAALPGKVALVTGASRGIGRGIALQLGEAGATVYVTGRQSKQSEGGREQEKRAAGSDQAQTALPTLQETADQITERGGKGVLVYCDHGNDCEVEELFDRIAADTDGRLDILVNNAFSAVNVLFDNMGKSFWEQDPLLWDSVNKVGLRNHYICSVYAARMMVPRKSGLIVNVSSAGGLRYLFNVAYGVGKAACDRMAADMAEELKPHNVTAVSLWPGAVKTEMAEKIFAENDDAATRYSNADVTPEQVKQFLDAGETIEYAGKAVVALAADANVIAKTGRVLTTGDLADKYGFKDIDGEKPLSLRSVKTLLTYVKWDRLASWTPRCVKVPGWVITAGLSRL